MPITRRSKLERYFDILKAVSNAGMIKQTHIMYKANLTWDELKKDLEWLLNLKLINKVVLKKGILYEITSEGVQALSHISSIESILKIEQEPSKSNYFENHIKTYRA
jgi:predicted transcriptional regulator